MNLILKTCDDLHVAIKIRVGKRLGLFFAHKVSTKWPAISLALLNFISGHPQSVSAGRAD